MRRRLCRAIAAIGRSRAAAGITMAEGTDLRASPYAVRSSRVMTRGILVNWFAGGWSGRRFTISSNFVIYTIARRRRRALNIVIGSSPRPPARCRGGGLGRRRSWEKTVSLSVELLLLFLTSSSGPAALLGSGAVSSGDDDARARRLPRCCPSSPDPDANSAGRSPMVSNNSSGCPYTRPGSEDHENPRASPWLRFRSRLFRRLSMGVSRYPSARSPKNIYGGVHAGRSRSPATAGREEPKGGAAAGGHVESCFFFHFFICLGACSLSLRDACCFEVVVRAPPENKTKKRPLRASTGRRAGGRMAKQGVRQAGARWNRPQPSRHKKSLPPAFDRAIGAGARFLVVLFFVSVSPGQGPGRASA